MLAVPIEHEGPGEGAIVGALPADLQGRALAATALAADYLRARAPGYRGRVVF